MEEVTSSPAEDTPASSETAPVGDGSPAKAESAAVATASEKEVADSAPAPTATDAGALFGSDSDSSSDDDVVARKPARSKAANQFIDDGAEESDGNGGTRKGGGSDSEDDGSVHSSDNEFVAEEDDSDAEDRQRKKRPRDSAKSRKRLRKGGNRREEIDSDEEDLMRENMGLRADSGSDSDGGSSTEGGRSKKSKVAGPVGADGADGADGASAAAAAADVGDAEGGRGGREQVSYQSDDSMDNFIEDDDGGSDDGTGGVGTRDGQSKAAFVEMSEAEREQRRSLAAIFDPDWMATMMKDDSDAEDGDGRGELGDEEETDLTAIRAANQVNAGARAGGLAGARARYEPRVLQEELMTEADDVIRATDAPERLQQHLEAVAALAVTHGRAVDADDTDENAATAAAARRAEREREASWMLPRLSLQASHLDDAMNEAQDALTAAAIARIMRLVHEEKLEVPYLITYEKEALTVRVVRSVIELPDGTKEPQLVKVEGAKGTNVLQPWHLWLMLELDVEWVELSRRRDGAAAMLGRCTEIMAAHEISRLRRLLEAAETLQQVRDVREFALLQLRMADHEARKKGESARKAARDAAVTETAEAEKRLQEVADKAQEAAAAARAELSSHTDSNPALADPPADADGATDTEKAAAEAKKSADLAEWAKSQAFLQKLLAEKETAFSLADSERKSAVRAADNARAAMERGDEEDAAEAAALSGKQGKRARRRELLFLKKRAKLTQVSQFFLLSAPSFGANVSMKRRMHEAPEAQAKTPDELGLDFIDHSWKDQDTVIKAACLMHAVELASEPRILASGRELFRRYATISTAATEKGKREIHARHQYHRLQYIKRKPLAELLNAERGGSDCRFMQETGQLTRDSYLRMLKAKEEGFLTLEIEAGVLADYKADWEPLFLSVANMEPEWDTHRTFVLDHLIQRHLQPRFVREAHEELLKNARDAVVDVCGELLREKAMAGPFRPEAPILYWGAGQGDNRPAGDQFGTDLEKFMKHAGKMELDRFLQQDKDMSDKEHHTLAMDYFTERFKARQLANATHGTVLGEEERRQASVVAIWISNDREMASFAVVLDGSGSVVNHEKLEYLSGGGTVIIKEMRDGEMKDVKYDMRKALRRQLKNIIVDQPESLLMVDAVIINTSAGNLCRRVYDLCQEIVEQQMNANYVPHDGELDSLQARYKPKRDTQMRGRPNIEVFYGEDEVPGIFANSARAEKEFAAYPATLRSAISMGRYAQSPLDEICSMCITGAGVPGEQMRELLYMEMHPLQEMLIADKGTRAALVNKYSCVLTDVVCQVGVLINNAIRFKHMQGSLQFVAGLGPRKAKALFERLARRGKLSARRQLADFGVVGELIGDTVYRNCVGFVRILDTFGQEEDDEDDAGEVVAPDPLDDTRVHPLFVAPCLQMAYDAWAEDGDEAEVVPSFDNPEEYGYGVRRIMQDCLQKQNEVILRLGGFSDPPAWRPWCDYGTEDETLETDLLAELRLDLFSEALLGNNAKAFEFYHQEEAFAPVIRQNRLLTLYDLRHELRYPFRDPRQKWVSPNKSYQHGPYDMAVAIRKRNFFRIAGEDPDEFCVHAHVIARVQKDVEPGAEYVRVMLPNNMVATLRMEAIEKDMQGDLSAGTSIECVINNIEHERWRIDLSALKGDLSRYPDGLGDTDRSFLVEAARKDCEMQHKEEASKTVSGLIKRTIKHEVFKNINHTKAKAALREEGSVGDIVIHPSKKGTSHLTITWMMQPDAFVHIPITEADEDPARPSGTGLGSQLKVHLHGQVDDTFESFDELIERYVTPLNHLIEDMVTHRRFLKGTSEQVRNKLREDKKKNPKGVAYALHHYYQEGGQPTPYFKLTWIQNVTPKSENVKVVPSGIMLRGKCLKGVEEMMAWFKKHHNDPMPTQERRRPAQPQVPPPQQRQHDPRGGRQQQHMQPPMQQGSYGGYVSHQQPPPHMPRHVPPPMHGGQGPPPAAAYSQQGGGGGGGFGQQGGGGFGQQGGAGFGHQGGGGFGQQGGGGGHGQQGGGGGYGQQGGGGNGYDQQGGGGGGGGYGQHGGGGAGYGQQGGGGSYGQGPPQRQYPPPQHQGGGGWNGPPQGQHFPPPQQGSWNQGPPPQQGQGPPQQHQGR